MKVMLIAMSVIFLLLLGIFIYLGYSWSESLFASAALAAVGTAVTWWKMYVEW